MKETRPTPFGEIFGDFVKERRNGTKIYRARDNASFLRVGPSSVIDEELRFHRRLIEQGYPVPALLAEGEIPGTEKYFSESSAGEVHFGTLFRGDVDETGAIQDETFRMFLDIAKKFFEAQKKEQATEKNWESVFLATHIDTLIKELPADETKILRMWEKVKTDLAETPFVLCHGDFNPFNILPYGVIDFETAFEGPLGYDLVSASSSIDWFPRRGDAELLAGYVFSEKQRQQLLALSPDTQNSFNALFVLRGVWLVVRMHKWPKLQAWRYAKFQEMTARYLQGESLYQWLYSSD